MLEDSYYLGIVKHLSYLFGLNDYVLQCCTDFEFGQLRKCRVRMGMCIECWDCVDEIPHQEIKFIEKRKLIQAINECKKLSDIE